MTAATVIGVGSRVIYGHGLPLWFDETVTAAIATQPDFVSLLRLCLTELSGPAFYMPIWAWVRVFGDDDFMLRMPGLIMSIAAPFVLYRWGHPDKSVRLFWAVIALLWLPALPFANDARPYPQLFFVACLQSIAFLRLMRRPTHSTALAWTTATTVLALTHYPSLLIGLFQGCIYMTIHRRAAAATWPALAPFVLLAAWMAMHLPFIFGFGVGGGHTPSIQPGLAMIPMIPTLLFGAAAEGTIIIVLIAATLALPRLRPNGRPTSDIYLPATGIAAFALALAIATVHQGFNPRYITPFIPAILFGIALWAGSMLERNAKLVAAMFAAMLMSSLSVFVSAASRQDIDARHLFGFEGASTWLMEAHPRRLVFLWTDDVGNISGDGNVADFAGYFFRRAGQPVTVDIVHPHAGRDTSDLARLAAGNDPRTAILWLANDRQSPHPAAPMIDRQDPRWHCRDFGGRAVTVTACRR